MKILFTLVLLLQKNSIIVEDLLDESRLRQRFIYFLGLLGLGLCFGLGLDLGSGLG